MASYHFHLTQVKRSRGQSVIAQAGYRVGEKLYNTYYGESSDFSFTAITQFCSKSPFIVIKKFTV